MGDILFLNADDKPIQIDSLPNCTNEQISRYIIYNKTKYEPFMLITIDSVDHIPPNSVKKGSDSEQPTRPIGSSASPIRKLKPR